MKVAQHIDLKPYNTFGFSVQAERMVWAATPDDVEAFFEEHPSAPSLVLGGGSNLLLRADVPGTVLKMDVPGIVLEHETDAEVVVKVGAGVVWNDFVMHCIEQGWGGVENLSLIPGSVGAAPMQNIGAYGVEIKEVFHSLDAYLWRNRHWQTFHLDECAFGYRESIFKHGLRGEAIITHVRFRLSKHPVLDTRYGAIQAELEAMGIINPGIRDVSNAVVRIRRSKLPDPREIGNSGSFFKNPVVSKAHFERLQAQYPEIVGYPSGDDQIKVAAGWLIEAAGYKGKRFGQYGVHDRQALVLVNYGGATGEEVFALSERIIHHIQDQFGIALEREVNVL